MKNKIKEKQLYGIRKFKKVTGSALLGVITIFGVAVTTGLTPQGTLLSSSFGTITVHAADVSSGVTVSDFTSSKSSEDLKKAGDFNASFKLNSTTGGNKGDTFKVTSNDFIFNVIKAGDLIKSADGTSIAKVTDVTATTEGDHEKSVITFELLDSFSSFNSTITTNGYLNKSKYYNTNNKVINKTLSVQSSNKSNEIAVEHPQDNIPSTYSRASVITSYSDSGVSSRVHAWIQEYSTKEDKTDTGFKTGDTFTIKSPEGTVFNTKDNTVGRHIKFARNESLDSSGKFVVNNSTKYNDVAVIEKVDGDTLTIKFVKDVPSGDGVYTTLEDDFTLDVTDSSKIQDNGTFKTNGTIKGKNTNGEVASIAQLNYLSGGSSIKKVPTVIEYKDGDKTVKKVPKGDKIPGEKIDVDGDEDVPDGYKPVTPNSNPSVPTDGNVIVPVVANKSTVTVNHKDEAGNVLKTTSSEGEIGSNYKTSSEKIDGYTLVKTPDNASGKYVSGGTTVEYIYHKNVTTYVDEKGNPITPDQAKDGKSYTHVKDEPQKNGDTKKVYHKIVTNFVDESGKAIMDPKDGTAEKVNVDGYTYIKTDVSKNGDVTHTYHKIVTTYIDENGKEITIEDSKDPKKYKFVKENVKPNGDIEKVYHKIVTKFVDESGKGISDPKDGIVDKMDISGYTFVKTETDDKGDQIHTYKANPVATKQETKKPSVDTGAEVAGSIGQILASIGAIGAAGGAYFKFGRKKK